MEDQLRRDSLADERTDIIHYRDVRGIDQFREHDVLILVGLPMISYKDMVEKARIMFGLNWNDEEVERQVRQTEGDTKVYKSPCYYNDGYGYEVETFQFSDPHIQQYYEHVIIQEMVQMIGRIRPYEGSNKHVYIISSTPLPDLRIDDMLTRKEFMSRNGHQRERRSEKRDIRAAIQSLPSNNFTIKELGAALGRNCDSQRDHLRKVIMRDHEYLGYTARE